MWVIQSQSAQCLYGIMDLLFEIGSTSRASYLFQDATGCTQYRALLEIAMDERDAFEPLEILVCSDTCLAFVVAVSPNQSLMLVLKRIWRCQVVRAIVYESPSPQILKRQV
jgi:hypothetical protein